MNEHSREERTPAEFKALFARICHKIQANLVGDYITTEANDLLIDLIGVD